MKLNKFKKRIIFILLCYLLNIAYQYFFNFDFNLVQS